MRITRFSTRFVLFVTTLLLAVFLTACTAATATPAPSPTVVPVLSTDTPTPLATAAVTQTLQPSSTPAAQPTATATMPPTATVPPTPDPALESVKLIGLGWYPNYDLMLTFEFPGAVDPMKYRVTLEDKEYKCEVALARFPNRLYCRGQGAKVLSRANIRVYQSDSDQPGFEKNVSVPFFP